MRAPTSTSSSKPVRSSRLVARWPSLARFERLAILRADAALVVRLVYDDARAVPAALQAALVDDTGIIRTEYLGNR